MELEGMKVFKNNLLTDKTIKIFFFATVYILRIIFNVFFLLWNVRELVWRHIFHCKLADIFLHTIYIVYHLNIYMAKSLSCFDLEFHFKNNNVISLGADVVNY